MPRSKRPALEPPAADQPTPIRLALLSYAVPTTILLMTLIYSTRLFIVQQEEAVILDAAARPLSDILAMFRSGFHWQAASPLYLLGMHFWLALIGGDFFWLRIPSALFYLAGVFLLAGAAHRWAKEQSTMMLLLLAAFWPYGFHYGALLTTYSLAFLLIAALTLFYLRFEASGRGGDWYIFCALALVLVYVNAVGWTLLLCLCVDDALRARQQAYSGGTRRSARWLATFAFLAAAYAPYWPGLVRALARGARADSGWLRHGRGLALNALFHVYVLPASESVAPWFWRFGAPMALAVLATLVLAWRSAPRELRRLLVYAGVLLVFLDAAGILRSQELMLLAPWFLLPLAVAFTALEKSLERRVLLIALVAIGGLAWFGIYNRTYYATGDFYEPWPNIAAGSGLAVREGGNVISNSPQFFFYLTYSLQLPQAAHWRYAGSLPETVRNPRVWDAAEWQAAGRPLPAYVLWVRSAYGDPQDIDEVGQYLDQHCGGRLNRYLAHDPAYPWTRSFSPHPPLGPWMIETHQYTCGEAPPAPGASSALPVPAPPNAAARPTPAPRPAPPPAPDTPAH